MVENDIYEEIVNGGALSLYMYGEGEYWYCCNRFNKQNAQCVYRIKKSVCIHI